MNSRWARKGILKLRELLPPQRKLATPTLWVGASLALPNIVNCDLSLDDLRCELMLGTATQPPLSSLRERQFIACRVSSLGSDPAFCMNLRCTRSIARPLRIHFENALGARSGLLSWCFFCNRIWRAAYETTTSRSKVLAACNCAFQSISPLRLDELRFFG